MTEPPSTDQQFIRKLRAIVEANMSKEDFDVEELAHEACLSRSAIHRRLRSFGIRNTSHFIREIRLQKAREMLRDSNVTASEVAYRVGFGSPTYFSKCFHEYYGYTPGEERRRVVPDDPDSPIITQPSPNANGSGKKSGLPGKKKIIALSAIVLVLISIAILVTNNPVGMSRDISIVVLPFKDLSGNPDNQYFADGIMEDILNNLYQVSNLRVISRTTSEHFRDTDLTSGEISRKLNAKNVLEGSVRREGEKVRITIQLIDGQKEKHIWSETYDRELTDILSLQAEIAGKVASKLNAVIGRKERNLKADPPTSDPVAWDYYLRARFLLHRADDIERLDMSREGLISSLKYYELAIDQDSGFADAYAGLANAWYNLSAWGFHKPYQDGIARAVKNFSRALELDPDCAEAHALKGVWLAYPERKFEESKAELRTAIKLAPEFSTAHQWYAQILMITGPIELARKHVDIAVKLEPYFWVVHNLSAWISYFEENNEKGIEACVTAHDLNPDFSDNYWLFALHYARLGRGDKAAEALRDLFSRYPSVSHLGEEVMDAYREGGTEGIFLWLIEVNMNRPLPVDGLTGNPFFIAWWYAIINDREQAAVWLEKTLDVQYVPWHYCNLITTNPDFDILRNDPRFIAFVRQTGLDPYNTRPAR